ncbi:MAG: polyphosphate kinase 2 family protein [Rhodospirillales bacterium]
MTRKKRPRLDDFEDGPRMKKAESDARLHELSFQMRRVLLAYVRLRRRAIVVLEGWDAAGKGGAIKRMTADLEPRHYKVWPIGPPEDHEQGRHYLYRFWQRLPEPGTIAIFDRSWYGRVLVERVERLAEKPAWSRAYGEINDFERMLNDDGVRIVKLFLHVSAAEQRQRFEERIRDRYKRWKITAGDIRNSSHRRAYTTAIEEMLVRTSTEASPWTVIAADDKHYARVAVLQHVTAALADRLPLEPPELDPDVARAAREVLGLDVARLVKDGDGAP